MPVREDSPAFAAFFALIPERVTRSVAARDDGRDVGVELRSLLLGLDGSALFWVISSKNAITSAASGGADEDPGAVAADPGLVGSLEEAAGLESGAGDGLNESRSSRN